MKISSVTVRFRGVSEAGRYSVSVTVWPESEGGEKPKATDKPETREAPDPKQGTER